MVDTSDLFDGVLEEPRAFSADEVSEMHATRRLLRAGNVEAELGRAGWYDVSAEPFPPPTTPTSAPLPKRRPVVTTVRRVWMARFNPGDPDWFDEQTDHSGSDVLDETIFPWSHPERAVADG